MSRVNLAFTLDVGLGTLDLGYWALDFGHRSSPLYDRAHVTEIEVCYHYFRVWALAPLIYVGKRANSARTQRVNQFKRRKRKALRCRRTAAGVATNRAFPF